MQGRTASKNTAAKKLFQNKNKTQTQQFVNLYFIYQWGYTGNYNKELTEISEILIFQ